MGTASSPSFDSRMTGRIAERRHDILKKGLPDGRPQWFADEGKPPTQHNDIGVEKVYYVR